MHRNVDLSELFLSRKCVRWLSVVVLFCWGADSNAERPTAGRLVIVGGALKPTNEPIYRAFLAGLKESSSVGVVPLASGVPEESGPLSVEDLQQYASSPERVFDTKLTNNQPEYAATAQCAELLGGCGALWFTGGDQSRIISALRPDAGDTVSFQAIRRLLEGGGTVGGSSAGAAMMSDPMICGGVSEEALLIGATDELDGLGVCVGKGLGLFPYGLTDQHFLRRGRFGRLLVALESTGLPCGFGVSENSAMVVDLSTDTISVIGKEGLTVIDRRDATKQGLQRGNLRVHLLSSGDQINGSTFEVRPASGKAMLPRDESDTHAVVRFPEMWDRYVISEMIKVVAANPSQPVHSDDGNFDYVMTADAETKFVVSKDPEIGLTAIGVLLDITPREGIERRIADLRRRHERLESE